MTYTRLDIFRTTLALIVDCGQNSGLILSVWTILVTHSDSLYSYPCFPQKLEWIFSVPHQRSFSEEQDEWTRGGEGRGEGGGGGGGGVGDVGDQEEKQ